MPRISSNHRFATLIIVDSYVSLFRVHEYPSNYRIWKNMYAIKFNIIDSNKKQTLVLSISIRSKFHNRKQNCLFKFKLKRIEPWKGIKTHSCKKRKNLIQIHPRRFKTNLELLNLITTDKAIFQWWYHPGMSLNQITLNCLKNESSLKYNMLFNVWFNFLFSL